MAKALGSLGTIHVSPSGAGGSYIKISNVTSVSATPSVTMVDATSNDSLGAKEKLPGDADTKVSVTSFYDPSDAGQTIILNACMNKTLIYLQYRPRGASSGDEQYVGTAYISKCDIPSKHEATQEMMFDAEFTNPVILSAQP